MKKEYINIPFSIPDIGDEEINAVVETLRMGWITTGPQSKKFEDEFKAYLGGNVEAIAVNSATSGLHLALESLGVGAGDEVIVPTLTFTATAEVVRYLGADPVLVDIDPTTMNIDPAKILTAITSRTKVIIPVHYAGLACQMDVIFSIAKRHNLKVIEDAAHALSSTYNKKMIGELQSDITVFSFYANKNITTGEGGMIVTDDKDYSDKMRIFRSHGITTDVSTREKTGAWFYEMVDLGYNYRISDIQCALGLSQLEKLPEWINQRQKIAGMYDQFFADNNLSSPLTVRQDRTHVYHLYVVQMKNRDKVFSDLREQGIGVNVHYVPVHLHPYYQKKFGYGKGLCPVAEKAYEQLITLPLYPGMTNKDVKMVERIIKDIVMS